MKYYVTKNRENYIGKIEQPENVSEEEYLARWLKLYPEDTPESVQSAKIKGRRVFQSFLNEERDVEGIECKTSFSIKGAFESLEDTYNSKRQSVTINATLIPEFKENFVEPHLEKIDRKKVGPDFGSITDSTHSNLPPYVIMKGGFAKLQGIDMKITDNGEGSTDQGVSLLDEQGNRIPCPTILVNEPKQLLIQLPGTVEAGNYLFEICTYMHGKHTGKDLQRAVSNETIQIIEENEVV